MTPAVTVGVKDDRYVPNHGDHSFDVNRYDLQLDYNVDLEPALRSRVDQRHGRGRHERDQAGPLPACGCPRSASTERQPKYTHRKSKVVVQPRTAIAAGRTFTVVVTYAGSPQPMPGLDGDAGWEELADGVIVGVAAARGAVLVPVQRPAVQQGDVRLSRITAPSNTGSSPTASWRSKRVCAAGTTWRQRSRRSPMATYLATVQIGRYVVVDSGT